MLRVSKTPRSIFRMSPLVCKGHGPSQRVSKLRCISISVLRSLSHSAQVTPWFLNEMTRKCHREWKIHPIWPAFVSFSVSFWLSWHHLLKSKVLQKRRYLNTCCAFRIFPFKGVATDPTCIRDRLRTHPTNIIYSKWEVTWTHRIQPNTFYMVQSGQ